MTTPYSRICHDHLISFPGSVKGDESSLFCVVSSRPLSETAIMALTASAERLGYDTRQIAFLSFDASDLEASPPSTRKDKAQALVRALEAIDPLCVVLADHETVEIASAGYNEPLALESKETVLGRGCCCFNSFEESLATDTGKQRAWACLKTLPSLVSKT